MAVSPFGAQVVVLSAFISAFLALRGVRKKSLTTDGGIAAFLVGVCLVSSGMRGVLLLCFYFIGNVATKYKAVKKSRMDATAVSTARGYKQVLCVSAVPTVLSLAHVLLFGSEQPIDFTQNPGESYLSLSILASHACNMADTLASELGMVLASESPRMITQPWQTVPPGTNGGVTLTGILLSIFGGALIGWLHVLIDTWQGTQPVSPLRAATFAATSGLVGSVLDSLLGAMLQVSYFNETTKKVQHHRSESCKLVAGIDVMSNEMVNLVSVAITSFLAGVCLGPVLYR